VENLKIRFAVEEDKKHLIQWMNDPEILRWFPMTNAREIEDACTIVFSYVRYQAVLTAVCEEIPCGIANLYLQPYRKLAHHALFAIMVAKEYRGKGVGTLLLTELMKLGKEKFHLELMHLEVYQGNPAISLYKRMGFAECGFQKHFTKEDGMYRGKYFMQKIL
jgi:GNAT superfamily N-acetyltransferase